jgi:hypothetical protein
MSVVIVTRLVTQCWERPDVQVSIFRYGDLLPAVGAGSMAVVDALAFVPTTPRTSGSRHQPP